MSLGCYISYSGYSVTALQKTCAESRNHLSSCIIRLTPQKHTVCFYVSHKALQSGVWDRQHSALFTEQSEANYKGCVFYGLSLMNYVCYSPPHWSTLFHNTDPCQIFNYATSIHLHLIMQMKAGVSKMIHSESGGTWSNALATYINVYEQSQGYIVIIKYNIKGNCAVVSTFSNLDLVSIDLHCQIIIFQHERNYLHF